MSSYDCPANVTINAEVLPCTVQGPHTRHAHYALLALAGTKPTAMWFAPVTPPEPERPNGACVEDAHGATWRRRQVSASWPQEWRGGENDKLRSDVNMARPLVDLTGPPKPIDIEALARVLLNMPDMVGMFGARVQAQVVSRHLELPFDDTTPYADPRRSQELVQRLAVHLEDRYGHGLGWEAIADAAIAFLREKGAVL